LIGIAEIVPATATNGACKHAPYATKGVDMSRLLIVLCCLVVGACLLAAALAILRSTADRHVSDTPYIPTPMAVYQSSSELRRSVVVATMDAAMPQGKNVIWCASFQVAWNRLGGDVLHSPPQIVNAEETASKLNSSKFSENDLPADCYYAAAGLVREGIVKRIDKEMQRRFHKTPMLEELDDPANAIVAYAYLEANIPFMPPYFDNPESLLFTDSKGEKSNVSSFGTNFNGKSFCARLSKQVKLLHCAYDKNGKEVGKITEVVIDPCCDSAPHQIILARVPAAETLHATWSRVERLMADYPRQADARRKFDYPESLLVPSMAWDITHHFAGLEGADKLLRNKGFERSYVNRAMQNTRFRLDRGGAELRSEAALCVCGGEDMIRDFVFDRPFFVFIRKRGDTMPFFAMYVANAELLCKAKAEQPSKDAVGAAPGLPSSERK
jgi:hypothetical protein